MKDIISYVQEKKIPLAVHINLTRRCNLHCLHCCVGKGRKTAFGQAGTAEAGFELGLMHIQRVFEELAQVGCLLLTLSGGEVLLRDDLLEIISRARELDFAVKIFTNGTLVGRKEAQAFHRLRIQEVHVSLYGADAKIHDLITGVSGSWTKSMEGIRWLREEGVAVKVKCPIMKQNLAEYRKVYELAVSLGADYAFDPMITVRDDGNRDPLNYRISQEDLQMVLADPIFQTKHKSDREREESFACSASMMSEISEEVLCSAGHYICFISPEGDINPCVQLPIFCGNILEHDFQWIWYHSPQMLRIRNLRMKDVRGCNNCRYLPWCARCPGLAYLEDGDLLGPSSAACWMVQAKEGDRQFNNQIKANNQIQPIVT